MKKLFVIDGLGILFRSFYATRELKNYKNENIAGIRGFIAQINKIIQLKGAKHMVVALDTGKKTWRHLASDKYKSNRVKTPDELIHQFEWIREACDCMGIRYFEGQECEADDWIASIAKTHREDAEIYIVSLDKDLCQLVDDSVFIYDSFSNTVLKNEDIIKKFGVRPSQMVDFLSLTGDCSDCVDGAKGIGPKTASKWLSEYPNLEEIIESIDLLNPKSRAEMLKSSIEKVKLAKTMISLRSSLQVAPLEELSIKPSMSSLKLFMERVGLFDLMQKIEPTLLRF